MSEIGDVFIIWLLYILVLLVLLTIVWRELRGCLSSTNRLILFFTLFILLATPVVVPETQSLAPAWLVSFFEWVFGHTDTAKQSITPVLLLLVFYVVILLASILRRRFLTQR